jgi:predicted transcriptional regulator
MSVKEAALEIVTRMRKDCTWSEVLYEIYVRKQIEAGLKDEADGRLIPHEEVFAKYAKKKKTKPRVVRHGRKKP